MADQNALQDDNFFPAMIAHSGTAGTAETRRVTSQPWGGLDVNITGGATNGQFGTLGTAGAAAFGTLQGASGAGTQYYVSGVAMVVASGTVDCQISFGSANQGTGILCRGQFPPGLGIGRTFIPVKLSGTNAELIYWLGGAGTVFFQVDYWKV